MVALTYRMIISCCDSEVFYSIPSYQSDYLPVSLIMCSIDNDLLLTPAR